MLYGNLARPFVRQGEDQNQPPRNLELKINEAHLLDTLLETTTKTVYVKLNLAVMGKTEMEEFIKLLKGNPGKQHFKLHLFDPLAQKSCNMTPERATINAHDVLPLLEKAPFRDFVEFDLR